MYDDINVDFDDGADAQPAEDDELSKLFDHILSIPSASTSTDAAASLDVGGDDDIEESDADFDDILSGLSQLGK